MDTSNMMRHWFKVSAGPKAGDTKCMHLWTDLPFEVRIKWAWYFEYRAALIKVANPKWKVETSWGSEPVKKPGEEHLKRKRDLMISKKAKIAEYQNKVNRYREAWTSLFPIEEDQPYCNALAKIERLKGELVTMEEEYQQLVTLSV